MRFPLNILAGALIGSLVGLVAFRVGRPDSVPPSVPAEVGNVAEKSEKLDTPKLEDIGKTLTKAPAKDQPGVPGGTADKVFVRGYAVSGRRVNVVLSDGRTYTERDKELHAVERNSVMIGDQKYFLWIPEERVRPKPVRWDDPEIKVGGDPVEPAKRKETQTEVAQGEDNQERNVPAKDRNPNDGRGVLEREALAAFTDPIHR